MQSPPEVFNTYHPSRVEITWIEFQKKSLRASEQDRDDVKQARKSWPYRLGHRNKQRLFYLDESGAQTNMIRNYGRSPRGERLVGFAPGGHWTSMTMVCAILFDRVVAPMVIEGAMNSWIFQGYVSWLLVPELQPGDTVIMDNLASHKSVSVKNAIEDAGAKLMFLPPYSPDLNPIENMWSKVKANLRSEAKRTKRTLVNAIGRAIKAVTPSDCSGFFRAAEIATSK